MKNIHDKLRYEERKISARLNRARHAVRDTPMLSGKSAKYELSERTRAISHGGIGAVHQMVRHLGLDKRINERLHLLKMH